MKNSIFYAIKKSVSVSEAARGYGYTPNRAGFICCPFHLEKTPSLKLYDQTYHCFGCGAHGSVIDFVGELFSLSPLDAAKKLNADFGLHLTEAPREELEDHRKAREARTLFEAWREQMLNQIDAAIRVANLADYVDLTDAEALAIRNREALTYWADVLLHEPLSEQMGVFRDRKGVERLCRMILQNTSTRSATA